MGLGADPNDPHPGVPVHAACAGISFRLVVTAPSGKTNIPGTYFP